MPAIQILPVAYHPDSGHYFRQLHHLPGITWLDSGERGRYNSRYDMLTALPREQITTAEGGSLVSYADGQSERMPAAPLDYLQQRLTVLRAECADTEAPVPFAGGAIGYLGYEALHDHYSLTTKAGTLPAMPDVAFGLYDWALVQDHKERQTWLCFLPCCTSERVAEMTAAVTAAPQEVGVYRCGPLQPSITPEDYTQAVARIQRYIHAGDCYQVNFAQRFGGDFSGSAAAAYLDLRQALPSPFSAYLDTPAGQILSLSPERFLELDGRRVTTQPIKGTAPRGGTRERDAELARTLAASEKNRAENLMIVDLLRNDLSKVSEPFSVEVPELFGLQSFANVHHLVSTVTGRLRDDASAFELLEACFPGGSITGAPKKRAMEIISELEDTKRSVYCGCIGYLSVTGHMDMNIAIRTLVRSGDAIYCWGGGGIVADSDPQLEYDESLHKVGILLNALTANSRH